MPNAGGESRTKLRELDFDPSGTVVQGNRPTIGNDFKLITLEIFSTRKHGNGGKFAYIKVFNSLMKNTFAEYGKMGFGGLWSLNYRR